MLFGEDKVPNTLLFRTLNSFCIPTSPIYHESVNVGNVNQFKTNTIPGMLTISVIMPVCNRNIQEYSQFKTTLPYLMP